MFDFPIDDGTVECVQCHYINIGSNIPSCEGCGSNPYGIPGAFKKFRPNLNDYLSGGNYDYPSSGNDDDDDDDDDKKDVILMEGAEQPQTKTTQEKTAAAVEKGMEDKQLVPYFNRYILLMRDEKQQKKSFSEEQLHEYITELFNSLQYKNDQSEGQLTFPACQICLDESESMVTMKACGHRVICSNDFNQYLSIRIRDGDILPWIPCPGESCSVPCHADNITQDGRLTYWELLSFLTKYMIKKLSRNENFITCIQCEKGGFLQIGPPKKQQVTCPICNAKQTIEKGADGDLDISFKKMIKKGDLRECPTCRHLTLKEKGVCNVIQCAKCGIWWNWRTREQGHNGKDLKQRARINGTLWEPGELRYQQELERKNPKEFKALLERNGIKYDPNYIRGGWNDQ